MHPFTSLTLWSLGAWSVLLLPAGPLREAWPRQCDLVLHTGRQPAFAGFRSERALANHGVRSDGSHVPLASLAGRQLIALAAIARPEDFFAMLRAQGLVLTQTLAMPDHDDFSQWQRPAGAQPGDGAVLLCTEKDAVKLWRLEPDALAVPLVFTPESAFFSALDAKLSSVDGLQAA